MPTRAAFSDGGRDISSVTGSTMKGRWVSQGAQSTEFETLCFPHTLLNESSLSHSQKTGNYQDETNELQRQTTRALAYVCAEWS